MSSIGPAIARTTHACAAFGQRDVFVREAFDVGIVERPAQAIGECTHRSLTSSVNGAPMNLSVCGVRLLCMSVVRVQFPAGDVLAQPLVGQTYTTAVLVAEQTPHDPHKPRLQMHVGLQCLKSVAGTRQRALNKILCIQDIGNELARCAMQREEQRSALALESSSQFGCTLGGVRLGGAVFEGWRLLGCGLRNSGHDLKLSSGVRERPMHPMWYSETREEC